METLRFRTKISKSGTIQIPKNSTLIDKEVDVVITPNLNIDGNKMSAKEFVDKWAGFLNPLGSEDPKYEYLKEKYE